MGWLPGAGYEELRIGQWHVRPRLGQLEHNDGETVQLKPKIMELLVYFVHHQGKVVSKDDLLESLWKDTYVNDNTLMHAISELRKALGDDVRSPRFIDTLAKRGYRLIAPVDAVVESSSDPPASSPPGPRIAVLPFEFISPDPSEEYLAETLTVMVTTCLLECDGLGVISRMSACTCHREPSTLSEIAQRLGANLVLEGSLLCLDSALQVAVRLYGVNEESLWSQSFCASQPLSLPDLQELARSIVRGMMRSDPLRQRSLLLGAGNGSNGKP